MGRFNGFNKQEQITSQLRQTISDYILIGRIYLVEPKMLSIPVFSMFAYALLLLYIPLIGLLSSVLLSGALYARFGIKRLTFLLAPASILVISLLVFGGTTKEQIEWNGRTYIWRDIFEVEVLK